MADAEHPNPDSEARKWFVIAIVCSILYVGVVFAFVINGTLDEGQAQQEEGLQHEQSN